MRRGLTSGPTSALWPASVSAAVLATVLLMSAHAAPATERWFKAEHAAAGRALFLRHCAACHGPDGEGATDWRRPLPDGSYPPPPLNGTGHAWHHPLKVLYATIMQGQGRMPGWKEILARGEALAIIAWFQSQWTDEIYAAWARMDRDSR